MNHPSVSTACPLCGSSSPSDYSVLYTANIPNHSLRKEVFSARRLPDAIHYQLVKCNNDQLVRSTPTFPSSVATQLYRKSEVTYQAEVNNLVKSYLDCLAPVLHKLNKTANILEIGCGSGFLLSALRKQGFINVLGIEPSTAAAKMADNSIRKHIITEAFSKKVVKSKHFDLICIFQTLDHMPALSSCMEDCYSCLNPGGYLFSLHHDAEHPLRKLLGEKHPIIDIEHLQLFSQRTSTLLFEKHGLLIEQVTSPQSVLSLSHLIWLIPLPIRLKKIATRFIKMFPLLNATFHLELGNVAIIGKKPSLTITP